MRNRINIDYVHSQPIVLETGDGLLAALNPEPELRLKTQFDRLRELEERSPSIVPDAEHWRKPRG